MTWGELKDLMDGCDDKLQVKIVVEGDEDVAYPITNVGYSNEHDAHVLRIEQ